MNTQTSEAANRALIEEWTKAVRAKDIDKVIAYYGPDVVVFDLLPPLQFVGAAHYRQNWTDWFTSRQGLIGYEMRDLTITAGDEVAFSRSLDHITGTRADGEKNDVWVRATVCFRKIDGHWKVTHEHMSVPYDMETLKASVDLKP
jgi:ketosteroid isomerase-like protein